MKLPYFIQLTCPKCKHEFSFPYGDVDAELEKVQQQKVEVLRRLHEINKSSFNRPYGQQRKQTIEELDRLTAEARRLKALRKVAHVNVDRTIFDNFKFAVCDLVGEEEFQKLIEYATKEAEAYDIARTMNRPYTRAKYKTKVISVTKL